MLLLIWTWFLVDFLPADWIVFWVPTSAALSETIPTTNGGEQSKKSVHLINECLSKIRLFFFFFSINLILQIMVQFQLQSILPLLITGFGSRWFEKIIFKSNQIKSWFLNWFFCDFEKSIWFENQITWFQVSNQITFSCN